MRSVRLTALIIAASAASASAQIITDMTPDKIVEAIKAGDSGKVASGELTKSSGWSWGSVHVATFSTPFMRVAVAARQAKREYREFAPDDVTPEMIAPELHVYAWAAPGDGPAAVSASSITSDGCTLALVVAARPSGATDRESAPVSPTPSAGCRA